MAFSKKMVEDRKAWLSNFVPGTFLDQRAPRIPYRDFIHKARRMWMAVLSSDRSAGSLTRPPMFVRRMHPSC